MQIFQKSYSSKHYIRVKSYVKLDSWPFREISRSPAQTPLAPLPLPGEPVRRNLACSLTTRTRTLLHQTVHSAVLTTTGITTTEHKVRHFHFSHQLNSTLLHDKGNVFARVCHSVYSGILCLRGVPDRVPVDRDPQTETLLDRDP